MLSLILELLQMALYSLWCVLPKKVRVVPSLRHIFEMAGIEDPTET